jgi:histidine triad (HIT) family protein
VSVQTRVCDDPNCEIHGCVFCRIVCGEEGARIVGETDRALAFLPTGQVGRGHSVVIPKRHTRDLLTADWTDLSDVMWLVKDVAERIKRNLNPDGMNLIQNTGEAARQTVFHIHFHIMPRWKGDYDGRLWPPSHDYEQDEYDRIQREILGEE